MIGVDWIEVAYEGKAAHASASPELGINAADAAAIAHMAIGLLRQHISGFAARHFTPATSTAADTSSTERSTDAT